MKLSFKSRWKISGGVSFVALLAGCAESPSGDGQAEFEQKSSAQGLELETVEEVQDVGPITAPLLDDSQLYQVEEVPLVDCTKGACQTLVRAVFSNLSQEQQRTYVLNQAAKEVREKEKRRREHYEELAERTEEALVRINERQFTDKEDDLMQALVHLEDEDFDFERLRFARSERSVAERLGRTAQVEAARAKFEAIVTERRSQLEARNEIIVKRIERLGGRVVARRTSANILEIAIPAKQASRLLAEHEVVGLEVDEHKLAPTAHGNGRREALGLPGGGAAVSASDEGVTGGTQGHSFGRVHVGVIEIENDVNGDPNLLNTGHPVFKNSIGASRIVDTEMCKLRGFERKCKNSASGSAGSHGTMVAATLLGDLTAGQDPNITSTTERVRRSGIARRAEMTYYLVSKEQSYANIATAIEAATYDDEIDIINMSLGEGSDASDAWCDNSSYSGVRSAIQAAENAGVLMVVSAGNNGSGSCTYTSFSTIPDTIAVGSSTDVSSLSHLFTAGIAPGSSRGFINVTLSGGRSVASRIGDFVVNGYLHYFPTSGSSYDTTSQGVWGTSISAPTVAGAAVLLKSWLYSFYLEDDYGSIPYALRAYLSVMGDGAGSSPGSQNSYTVDSTSGYGHLRFVDLHNEIGSGAWGFGGGAPLVLTEGEMRQWPVGNTGAEPTHINGWKFAALIDYDYYGDSPDVKFELVDRCPAGGGEQIIKTAARGPLKARLRMSSAEMSTNFHGRCLWIRATAESLPGSSVKIWALDYYYSNSRSEHDM